jgi:hypothetical protein
MRYSPSTKNFYPDEIHYPDEPDDLINVTQEEFNTCISRSHEQEINVVDGKLFLVDKPSQSVESAREQKVRELVYAYKSAIGSPVTFKTAAKTISMFATDTDSLKNIQDAIDAGEESWKFNFWLDAKNAVVAPFTFADLKNLQKTIVEAPCPTHNDLLSKIALVQSATTPESALAVNFN